MISISARLRWLQTLVIATIVTIDRLATAEAATARIDFSQQPEHVGGDANRFRQYFSSLAPAPKATELARYN
jgi:hypothetical protein